MHYLRYLCVACIYILKCVDSVIDLLHCDLSLCQHVAGMQQNLRAFWKDLTPGDACVLWVLCVLCVTHASYVCLKQHVCIPHNDATGFQTNYMADQSNTASQAHSKLKPVTKLSFIAIPG